MDQVQIVDQIVHPDFVEYVVRVNPDGTGDFRVQADGTLADLQTQISTKLTQLTTPPIVSEVETGTFIDLSPTEVTAITQIKQAQVN